MIRNTVWWSTNASGEIESAILMSPFRKTCCSESKARPASSLRQEPVSACTIQSTVDFCSEIPLDEVGAILHHHAQLAMPLRALPLRHEVQAMHTLVALAVGDARLAR
jgi:hypothetical protein